MKWLCIDFLLVQPFQQKLKNTTLFWNRLYLVKNRTRLITFFWQGRASLVRFFTRYSRFQKNVVFLSFCWNGCTSKKSIQSHFIYYRTYCLNAKDSYTSKDIQHGIQFDFNICISLPQIRKFIKDDLQLSFKKGASRPVAVDSPRSQLIKRMFAIEFGGLWKVNYLYFNID